MRVMQIFFQSAPRGNDSHTLEFLLQNWRPSYICRVHSFDLVSIDALLNCMRPNCCKTFKAKAFWDNFEINSQEKEF